MGLFNLQQYTTHNIIKLSQLKLPEDSIKKNMNADIMRSSPCGAEEVERKEVIDSCPIHLRSRLNEVRNLCWREDFFFNFLQKLLWYRVGREDEIVNKSFRL